jgi:hypothetical protein
LALTAQQQENLNRWVENDGTIGHPTDLLMAFTEISKVRNLKTSQVIVGSLRLALAAHDAYVQSWKAKYQFQRIRPQTYIQETLDPTWRSRVPDNNTPEYGSSWVTVTAAWVEVIRATVGSTGAFPLANGVSYTDLPSLLQDVSSAQSDAGLHIPSTLTASQAHGTAIGKKINELSFRKP